MTHVPADLAIRPAEVSDAAAMVEAMRVQDLQNFLFFEQEVTVERQTAYLEKILVSPHNKLFVILYQGRIVGTCGLHEIDWQNKNARLGIMIFSTEFRGRSLGSGALRLLIKHGFRAMGMYKLYLKVFAENTGSCTKYAHLGLQFEARLRRQYLLRGEYHDMVVMSVFDQDWPQ